MNTALGSTTTQPTLQEYLWQVVQSRSWQGALSSNTADPDVMGDTWSSRLTLPVRERDLCSSGNGLGTCWTWKEMEDDDTAVELYRDAPTCQWWWELPATFKKLLWLTSLDSHTCFGIVRVVFKLKITLFWDFIYCVFHFVLVSFDLGVKLLMEVIF